LLCGDGRISDVTFLEERDRSQRWTRGDNKGQTKYTYLIEIIGGITKGTVEAARDSVVESRCLTAAVETLKISPAAEE
jgi:hypothetical protein